VMRGEDKEDRGAACTQRQSFVRCFSIASQAASSSVLKGEPVILIALRPL